MIHPKVDNTTLQFSTAILSTTISLHEISWLKVRMQELIDIQESPKLQELIYSKSILKVGIVARDAVPVQGINTLSWLRKGRNDFYN